MLRFNFVSECYPTTHEALEAEKAARGSEAATRVQARLDKSRLEAEAPDSCRSSEHSSAQKANECELPPKTFRAYIFFPKDFYLGALRLAYVRKPTVSCTGSDTARIVGVSGNKEDFLYRPVFRMFFLLLSGLPYV